VPVEGGMMLVVAVIGLLVNVAGAFVLMRYRASSLNIRGAFLHIIGDAVSSVGVIIGGVVITMTGWYRIDPILSMLIALAIIAGAVKLVLERARGLPYPCLDHHLGSVRPERSCDHRRPAGQRKPGAARRDNAPPGGPIQDRAQHGAARMRTVQ
jgi:hypothetical protein